MAVLEEYRALKAEIAGDLLLDEATYYYSLKVFTLVDSSRLLIPAASRAEDLRWP